MTIERAIEIIQPGGVAKNPREYEVACKMAAAALRLCFADETKRQAVMEAGNESQVY